MKKDSTNAKTAHRVQQGFRANRCIFGGVYPYPYITLTPLTGTASPQLAVLTLDSDLSTHLMPREQWGIFCSQFHGNHATTLLQLVAFGGLTVRVDQHNKKSLLHEKWV